MKFVRAIQRCAWARYNVFKTLNKAVFSVLNDKNILSRYIFLQLNK